MRADRYDVASTPPADGNDLVTCSIHRSRRLAKFCLRRPVYNADRVMVSYTYECRDGAQCSSASRNSFVRHVRMGDATHGRDGASQELSMKPLTPTPTTAADVVAADDKDAAPQQPRTGAARGPNRYYDLTNQRNPGVTGMKKVCWNCGMEGHEKPECRNALCRTCHTIRGYHHLCQEPRPSPFLNLSPTILLSEDMSSVQCVSCSSLGHFDCSTSRETRIPSCCFCGEWGHNAYDCRRRKERVPDSWVTRVNEAENGMYRRENCGVFGAVPPGFTAPSNVSVPPGYNQGFAWRGKGASSGVETWNAGGRENGPYGRVANSGGHYATNSRPQNDRRSHSEYGESRYNGPRTGEVDHYANCGNKRPRWGDDDDDFRRTNHHYNSRPPNHYHGLDWNQQGSPEVGRNYTGGRGDGERPHAHQSYHSNDRYRHKQRRRNRGRDDSGDDCDNLF